MRKKMQSHQYIKSNCLKWEEPFYACSFHTYIYHVFQSGKLQFVTESHRVSMCALNYGTLLTVPFCRLSWRFLQPPVCSQQRAFCARGAAGFCTPQWWSSGSLYPGCWGCVLTWFLTSPAKTWPPSPPPAVRKARSQPGSTDRVWRAPRRAGSPRGAATRSPSPAPRCSGRTAWVGGFPGWASDTPLAPTQAAQRPLPGCSASVSRRCLPWTAWFPSPWRTASPPRPRCPQRCPRSARPGRAQARRKAGNRRTCWVSRCGGSACWSQSRPPWHRNCWCRRRSRLWDPGGWCCFHAAVARGRQRH